jgi:hypothetical protein
MLGVSSLYTLEIERYSCGRRLGRFPRRFWIRETKGHDIASWRGVQDLGVAEEGHWRPTCTRICRCVSTSPADGLGAYQYEVVDHEAEFQRK